MITMNPIGFVRSTRTGMEDDNWEAEEAHVELDGARFSPEALTGITDFSHVEILFWLDRVDPAMIENKTRHPRNNKAWPKVGIFAQRGRNRPNRMAATICRVVKVDRLRLYVEGLDAIDGSPVLDIKPWVVEFGPRGPVLQPEWITELMKPYWRR